MATYDKFQQYIEDLHHAVHDFSSDALEVALSNEANAPDLAADAILADFTEIAYTWISSLVLTTNISAQAAGVYTLQLNDLTIAASGGTAAAFRYVTVFNQDTAALVDPLICRFDYGSDLTLNDGESLTVDFESDGSGNGDLFTAT